MKAVAISIVLALVPAFMFAQGGVSDPAKASVSCPDAECHTAPFFRGSGGFVGELDTSLKVDGEDIAEATLVVTCGNITTTASAAPNDDGKVVHLFTEDNGLACDQDGGEINIHGLKDGGWYWLHDETNSAVSNLLPKDVLGNTQTAPVDVSGGDIEMTSRDYATLVKDTTSGRVGILPHILPAPPAAAPTPTPKCGDDRRKGCVLTGEYTVDIMADLPGLLAEPIPIAGRTIGRSSVAWVITVSIGGTGNIKINENADVTANFVVSGPDGTEVPDLYTITTGLTNVASIELPAPVLDDTALANPNDPCRENNQHRDNPITVVVTLDMSANTIPGFTADDGPSASYEIACPVLEQGSEGVELIPDNPFPID